MQLTFAKVLLILLNRVEHTQRDCLKIPRLIRLHHPQKSSFVIPCPGFTGIKMHVPEHPWIPLSLLRQTQALPGLIRFLCRMQLLKHHQPQRNHRKLLKHQQLKLLKLQHHRRNFLGHPPQQYQSRQFQGVHRLLLLRDQVGSRQHIGSF